MPAAAVIHKMRALSGIIGRKAFEGGKVSEILNPYGSTEVPYFKLLFLRYAEETGIPIGGVKSVDNGRNTKSEGRFLGIF